MGQVAAGAPAALFRVAPGRGEGGEAEPDRANAAADVEGGGVAVAAAVVGDTAG